MVICDKKIVLDPFKKKGKKNINQSQSTILLVLPDSIPQIPHLPSVKACQYSDKNGWEEQLSAIEIAWFLRWCANCSVGSYIYLSQSLNQWFKNIQENPATHKPSNLQRPKTTTITLKSKPTINEIEPKKKKKKTQPPQVQGQWRKNQELLLRASVTKNQHQSQVHTLYTT